MGKDQEFLDAARNGNISYIEKVLNQRAKRAGPLASLRRGPGVNIQDSGGYSALHHACINGHSDIVKLLLNNEASPNLPDSRGSSPLHLAAWAGHQEIVKMLLTHPFKPAQPNLQTIENETPLHCAAQHGHTGALALLLAHNADPNMRNARGETPLDLAAQYGRLQAVQMLIRAHPELIAPYSSALIAGVSSSSGGGGGVLIGQQRQKSRHSSPLPHSGSVSTPSPSSPSITSSPATPTRNIFPHTCLHLASRNGHKNIVEVLLAAGVSVNLLTPSGTALHEAALCGKESVVRTLLRAGIDLNATDAEGRTALDILKEFPPHVTKHIIAVINNFRNQMDVDESEEVVVIFRHQHPPPPPPQRQSSSLSQYQKQQHNNHYHFNSNNHLLNHAHSMQQSSAYVGNSGGGGGSNNGGSCGNHSKQRYGANLNGGKSLDSGLQPDHYAIIGRGGYQDVNSPVHSTSTNSQNEMGISPSSSMSSFEPVSVSPRSRSSTGGITSITANNPMHMSTFAPGPPKKPPRRNLSVSPTHSGQTFSYTSPNHQQQQGRTRQQHRSPSTDIPHSGHQSHGSMGGMSFDETIHLRDRHRGERLYASARESGRSTTGALLTSSSNDMLERMNYSSEERTDSTEAIAMSNSMKRPLNKWRDVSTEIINCENPTLKSYNPNRKLKRNRNSYSLSISDTKENKNDNAKPQTPLSPTNYQQPPTPDHPPPSSSQAERTIHERIRPLSMEYKRRSALVQLQQQQQNHSKSMIDSSTSPAKHWQTALIPTPTFDYPVAVGSLSPKQSANASPTTTMSNMRRSCVAGIQGSSGSLSSSMSHSDHSISTDCVEEFVSDAPFAGLLKGSSVNMRHEKRSLDNRQLNIPPPSSRSVSASAAEGLQKHQQQRMRPPIPIKPILPDCNRIVKSLTVTAAKDVRATTSQEGCDEADAVTRSADNSSHISQNISISFTGDNENGNENKDDDSNANGNGNDDARNEDTDAALSAITTGTTKGSGILSPFNAEEARKKISEIIESFGSGILNSTLTPTNDIELEFEDVSEPGERREMAIRLRNAGLLHLKRILFENGYDNYNFVNGVFEPSDIQLMDIQTPDANKLITFVRTLPKAEFLPHIVATNQRKDTRPDSNGDTATAQKGVATLSEWLQSINLPEYIESFSKHLYNTIDSVCGVWDVELQTVLEINKLGHRRRILQSVAYIRQIREPSKSKNGENENNEFTKLEQLASANGGTVAQPQKVQPQQRTSITGYRKNRPAPQPPTEKPQQPQLQIRAPSELLLGLPANLRTKWRHSANVLLNDKIKYEVYYLGSTVVKDLRGTESTRKSIQKLKHDDIAQKQQKENQPGKLVQKKPALVCLAISHLGVEFSDVNSKHTICEHEIQNINCACQDSDDLRHFAYITKESDFHYCHVFYVESTDLATDIILTLGQAFEVAYQLALRDGITQTSNSALGGNSLLGGGGGAADTVTVE
ncbi:ankyrin repeat and sterile alpha motif domain-containing protein 1B isoform X2 [Eurosta solidaginis]|uniref:ankyrin repeat and sterile alpha motif domain-containing protein 1B isoform X2 n=1 Tax=Eurosta solidaginis TaxID=178769 RepID=UPI003531619E